MSLLTIEEEVIQRLRELPADRQRQVLEFVHGIAPVEPARLPRKSVRGLCTDLDFHLTAEDCDDARREMWANFPRELPPE